MKLLRMRTWHRWLARLMKKLTNGVMKIIFASVHRGFWRAKLFALVLVLVDYTDYFFIVWADITNILFSCLCGTRSLPNNCLKIIIKKGDRKYAIRFK